MDLKKIIRDQRFFFQTENIRTGRLDQLKYTDTYVPNRDMLIGY